MGRSSVRTLRSMLVQRDGDDLRVGLHSTEHLYVNNALSWLCYGAHDLEDDAYEERFGVPHSVFVDLLTRVGASPALTLSVPEAQLVGRCLDEMLSGPAAIDGAGRGRHDWLLLGNSEDEFRGIHAEWRRLLDSL